MVLGGERLRYLNLFGFSVLGSTSLIGPAVNLKTIRAMGFAIPKIQNCKRFII